MAKVFGLLLICVCGLTDLITFQKAKAENIGTAICEQYLRDEHIISHITKIKDGSTPCACVEYDIAHDAMFEKRGNCYDEWLFNDGVRQRCCYSENGKLLTGYPNGGFNILDGIGHSMDAVYESCCHGNNNYTCKAFYEINTSDDCKRYKEPMSALSWGDPVIQTVGSPSYNYSFNGHGEYIFLKSQQGLEIQARLDYLVPGNNDSTIFTAFVFSYKSESIQVTFNRSKAFLSLHLSDGKLWKTTGACTSEPFPYSSFVLMCSAGFKVIQRGTAVDITTDGNFMNINVAHSERLSNYQGMAGNVRSGNFVGPNGTLYRLNSSERAMFEYGESWSIRRDKTLSHFIYNVTDGHFDVYNTYSEPKFLTELLNNFKALFGSCNETDLSTINSTCKNTWENVFNRECLLTIARTCNISLGEAIHQEVEKQHKELLFRRNTAPSFKNTMPNDTYMLFNGNTSWSINLTEMVIDESMIDLQFTVEPMMNSEMEMGDDGVFNWTVGTAFRNTSERTLRFVVHDAYNMTDSHTVNFRYCGCDKPSECKFESETDDNAECTCPNRFVEGKFCENKIDPCSRYVCYENDTCNKNYSGDGSPCAECPKKGFYEENIGSTQYCRDLNECNDTRTHNCEQECFDDVGSYHCGCKSGYLLNHDNSTCADKDECVLGNYSCPNSHEACVNIPGNYSCGCESGYSKNNANAPCVQQDSQMYFGYLEYISPTNTIPQTNDSLQSVIANSSTEFTRIFNGATNFLKIEIYRIYKRADVAGLLVHFDFVVHMTSKRGRQDIMKDLGGRLNQQIQLYTSPQLILNPPLKVFLVQEPDAGGICDVVPKRSDCLEQSTHCVNREIDKDYYDCQCNAGFKKPITGKKRDVYCDDVNECELFKNNNTTGERCVHGQFCSNTYGSWNCTCPTDRLWMSVGTTEDPIYRCQGNHSYLGNITFIWDASKEKLNQSIIVSFLKAEINKQLMDPSLDAERKTAVPITSLLVSVTVLSNTSFIPPPFGDSYMITYEFRIRMGDPISTKRLQDIAHDCFKTNTFVGPARFQNMTIFNESDNELCKRTNNGSCDMRTTVCVQANGTTNCKCKPGYNMHPGDSHACQDVDECSSGYTCNGGTCENTEGNWTCKCPLETSRVVLNETVQTCSADAFNMCTSMETPYRLFACPNGERICENSTLSCQCHTGYIVNGKGINSTCADLHECSNTSNPCGNGACVNTIGSYSCDCNKGFIFNTTETTCIDIDECLHQHDICVNGICTNNDGSYTCTCLNGYNEQFSNPYVTYCTDINECSNASYSCDGTCTNQPGSFTCACPSGYVNYTSSDHMHFMCKDFDECANPSGYQCINGTCNNTNGSWECVCGVSSQPLKLNNSVIQCIEIYRYSMQFEVQEISLPGGRHPTDKEIKGLLIKQVTDILNTSQALGGKVLFPVELLTDVSNHPLNGNITINVTVILSTMSNDSALQTVFEKSNTTQRTIVAGNILVISLSKTEIHVDQCNLHSRECDYNTTVCVFDKTKGRVSCECLTAYKGLKYDQGVGFCEPIKESKEEFAYVATISITIDVNISNDHTTLKEMVKLQITSMYQAMFPSDKIWVEIVKMFDEKVRRKRDTKQGPIQYIVHTNESKNETDFTEAWKNCTNINSSCHDRIQNHSNTSFVMSYDPPVFDNQTELCNISNVCDKNTTTCNDTSAKVVCSCMAGYANITLHNDTSGIFYACKLPADHPVFTTTTTSTTTTSTTTTSSTCTTTISSKPAQTSTIIPQENPTTQRTHMTASSSSALSETGKTGSPPNTVTIAAVETDRPVATATVNTVAPNAETTTTSKVDVGVKKDDKPESSSNTALIATGASLGIVVLILMITIIVVCRLRSKKAQDSERIKLRELEKEHKNGFDNSLLRRNYLRSDSKQNSVNDLRETDRDERRNSYYGGPFKPIEPTYTRPFKAVDPEPTWDRNDRNGHEHGIKGRSGSLPDINGHVDMRMAPETRRMSQPRTSDPVYSSPRKDKDPPPTQKPVDNYRQNMVRVFPESGERLPRAKTNQFPRKTANGRISPEPDYYDDPPLSPKPDYNGKRPRDRLDASNDSGLNGFSRSSGSPEVQRSRESNGYGSLRRGRYRMDDTPF